MVLWIRAKEMLCFGLRTVEKYWRQKWQIGELHKYESFLGSFQLKNSNFKKL